ncbi:MAG: tRNA (guanosine(37)-N1)-methyltransferase TrmD [Candidatus Dormibacteraeota bacterium]|nr:tRNA (guanosine(37)-N1)-methyltransferase TrmD [Candidatus Dormibacteraeota bacterium]
MRFDVVTIFPAMFGPVFCQGVVGRALREGRVELVTHDLRDHSQDQRHRQVDDAPFGGGAGMVLMAEPILAAVEAIRPENQGPVIFPEPWGEPFTQDLARELAREPGLVIVCGRYEGIDDRAREALGAREISIGDYVLSGGELPGMVLIDAISRLQPGVLGDAASLTQDALGQEPGGYPQYTRPARWRDRSVPETLLSGDHAAIARWRRAHARGPLAPTERRA